jgi:hypothetical protein
VAVGPTPETVWLRRERLLAGITVSKFQGVQTGVLSDAYSKDVGVPAERHLVSHAFPIENQQQRRLPTS